MAGFVIPGNVEAGTSFGQKKVGQSPTQDRLRHNVSARSSFGQRKVRKNA